MSFLAPLFLVGAAAIAGPILFHLIRRTVRARVKFSTLMFLKPTPPRLTKRSRLENLLLLLLRCAVICLLAVSFARPYFQRSAVEPPKPASGKRIIILLDTSASLRRAGLWDAAKRTAIAAVRRAEPGDSVAVIAFDQSPQTLISFEQWRAAQMSDRAAAAIARIEAAKLSWHGTHLGKALTAAAEQLLDAARADSEGEGRSQIVLVSDLQQGARLDGLQGFEWPRGLEVVLQPVGSEQLANAGVQLLAASAGESLSATNRSLRARVVNSPGAKSEQFKLGWTAAGGSEFVGTAVDLHVPGGQNRSIALPSLPTNGQNFSLLLAGDAEAFDNRAFHAAPPRQSIKLTYIGVDDANDPNGQLFYLKRAFPETASLAVKVDSRRPGTNAPVDANLILATTLDAADAPILKAHLQAGKMLFVVAGENADLSVLAAITEGAAPGVREAPGAYVMLAQVDFEHPFFSQFRDARFNDFTKIHFWKHRQLDLAALPKARVIASFDDNAPALVEIPVGKGALCVMASGWNPADSQFALSTKFVPFLFTLLEQSSPLAIHTGQLTVGDSIPFPADYAGGGISLKKPDGTSVDWKKGEVFLETDQPGFYTSTEPKLTYAVNMDPAESRTAPIPEEQLASLGLPLKVEKVALTSTAAKEREQLLLATEQENRQKLWRRLLLAALALLMIEAFAGGWASRRQVATA